MKKFLFFISLLAFIFSCSDVSDTPTGPTIPLPPEREPISKLGASPDSRFMGRFAHYSGTTANNIYVSYTFYNNNKLRYYFSETKNYYEKKPSVYEEEWKKENGIYYIRLWDNQFSDWEVFELEYIDNTKIKIDNSVYNFYE